MRTFRTGAAAGSGGGARRSFLAGLAALGLTVGLVGARPALASETTRIAAGVRAGQLAVTVGQPRFGPAASRPDGRSEMVGDLGVARVVDARGSGGGWSLRVSAAVEAAPGAPTLPSDALTIVAVEAIPEAGRAPVNTIRYPLAVALQSGARPTRFFSAAAGSGMGTVSIRPKVRLRLPPAARPDAYRAHLTIGVVAGP